MNKSNLAYEPPKPQGEVVHFPRKERQAMSKREEGYTRMPHAVIDDQIMAQLSDKAFKCLMFIMRQTVGFDRSSHTIAITQFQKYCGIKKRDTVMACIKDLEDQGLIKVERKTGCLNSYFFTPDQYRQTGPVPSNGSTLKRDGTSTTKRDGTSTVERDPIKETLKENIKETHNTEIATENSVDEILNLWKPDLNQLNVWLQRSGEMPMTETLVKQLLIEINAHYETQLKAGLLTKNQMYSKFVKWVKREFKKPAPKTQSSVQQSNLRNVNDAWGEVEQYAPVVDDVDTEGML